MEINKFHCFMPALSIALNDNKKKAEEDIKNLIDKQIGILEAIQCINDNITNNYRLFASNDDTDKEIVIAERDDKFRYYEALFACFLSGLELTDQAILQGAHIQAMGLLRQRIEILASMREEFKGIYNTVQPNYKEVGCLKTLCGLLSEAVHSRPRLISHFFRGSDLQIDTMYPSGNSYIISYDKGDTEALYNLSLLISIRILLDFIIHIETNYGKKISMENINQHKNKLEVWEIDLIRVLELDNVKK